MESPEELLQENVGFEVRKSIEFFFSISGALSPRWAKILGYFRPSGQKFLETFAQTNESGPEFLPIWAKADEDPNTFEEFLEPKEYINLGHLFTTDRIFSSKDELVDWAKQIAMKAKTYLIINRYQRSRAANRRPYVTLACERGGAVKKYTKSVVYYEEEEIPIKRWGP
ncbi:hypothetical protein M9H77_03719 [Catharanthus roseus]|uniref:Uncharacterized protein n=1 Tax=Catharanthus roseus TaxID=4058 RepID=A0ACC0CC25_CATRO|nr:hypothetical protein M9H77_03719 [Catharanthus roseus]